MAEEQTLYSQDRTWKVTMTAYKKKLFVYNSIGTDATVYHWEKTHRFLFFGSKSDWVERKANQIKIRNMYTGNISGVFPKQRGTHVQEEIGNNVSYWQTKQISVGTLTVSLNLGSGSISPGASGAPPLNPTIDLDSVSGIIGVQIGSEWIGGSVDLS
ncbi:MAG: hypothetical protein H0X37_16295 [Herpetosiphonaceae bacterium]|nr:hypothetical protein [Herpetosiphonaceae bacterium]